MRPGRLLLLFVFSSSLLFPSAAQQSQAPVSLLPQRDPQALAALRQVASATGWTSATSPSAITGPEDGYTDWAVDFQYDRTLPQFKNDVLSFRGSYIRENSNLAASFAAGGAALVNHHLNTIQGNVEYHYGTKLSGTVGYFNITGTADPLIFAQAPVSGSASGSPASSGYLLNASYWPQQNIGITAEYTGYMRFNGGDKNYDGAGRDATANNATYLMVRFVF